MRGRISRTVPAHAALSPYPSACWYNESVRSTWLPCLHSPGQPYSHDQTTRHPACPLNSQCHSTPTLTSKNWPPVTTAPAVAATLGSRVCQPRTKTGHPPTSCFTSCHKRGTTPPHAFWLPTRVFSYLRTHSACLGQKYSQPPVNSQFHVTANNVLHRSGGATRVLKFQVVRRRPVNTVVSCQ